VELDRSTLANWVGGAAWWLEPLRDRLAEHVFASQKLFADDTPIPVLDPGRGRTKTGRLWVYARDDRPWSGSDPPAAVYFYSPDRRAERPVMHLERFKGTLQVDGYAGFEQLIPTRQLQTNPLLGRNGDCLAIRELAQYFEFEVTQLG
jgi:transposase